MSGEETGQVTETTDVTEVIEGSEVTTPEPAGEQVAQETDSEPSTSSQEADDEESAKPKSGAEKRIDQLVWEREEAKRERDYYKSLATKGKEETEPTSKPSQPQTLEDIGPPPKLSEFDYDEDKYNQAFIEWSDKRQEIKETQRAAEREQQEAMHKAQSEYTSSLETALEQGKTKYKDFEKVIYGPGAELSLNLMPSVVFSENAADVAYHLGKNRDLVERLNKMPQMRAVMEIGRLSERLATKAPAKVTTTPEPITTVGGEEPPTQNLENLSGEDYRKARGYSPLPQV